MSDDGPAQVLCTRVVDGPSRVPAVVRKCVGCGERVWLSVDLVMRLPPGAEPRCDDCFYDHMDGRRDVEIGVMDGQAEEVSMAIGRPVTKEDLLRIAAREIAAETIRRKK